MQKITAKSKNVPRNASLVPCSTNLSLNRVQRLSEKSMCCSYNNPEVPPLCQCGCTQPVKWSKRNNCWNNYINHHACTGRHWTEETKEKVRQSNIGEKNPCYGRKHPIEERKKMRNEKEKNGMFGKQHSKKTKEKMRLSRVSYIEQCFNNGSPIYPTIGKNEKQILDNIEKEQGIKIERQHPVIGYFVDGYCRETNTIYEVDERHHFDTEGNLLEQDIQREENIREHLICSVVRIRDEKS